MQTNGPDLDLAITHSQVNTTFPVSSESPAAEFLKFIWFPLNVLPQQHLIKYDPWRLERIWAGLLVFKENQA